MGTPTINSHVFINSIIEFITEELVVMNWLKQIKLLFSPNAYIKGQMRKIYDNDLCKDCIFCLTYDCDKHKMPIDKKCDGFYKEV